jgi:hypothetical protein
MQGFCDRASDSKTDTNVIDPGYRRATNCAMIASPQALDQP